MVERGKVLEMFSKLLTISFTLGLLLSEILSSTVLLSNLTS